MTSPDDILRALASNDTLELIGKDYRLGFCIGEEPSWFVVEADGQSDSGSLDAKFRNAIENIVRRIKEQENHRT